MSNSVTALLNQLSNLRLTAAGIRQQVHQQTADLQAQLAEITKQDSALVGEIKLEATAHHILKDAVDGARVEFITTAPKWDDDRLLELAIKYGIEPEELFACRTEAGGYYRVV